MKIRLSLLLFLMFPMGTPLLLTVSSQPGWQWAVASQCNSTGYEDALFTTSDQRGNIFVCSVILSYTTWIISGPDTINIPPGQSAVIINKADTAGHFIWSKALMNRSVQPMAMEADAQGNLYLFAACDTGICYWGSDVLVHNPTPGRMYFWAKLDSNGNILMARNVCSARVSWSGGLTVDTIGNIFVAGVFDSSVSIDTFHLTSNGGMDIFLAAYSPSGVPFMAEQWGGTGHEMMCGLKKSSQGNLFIEMKSTSSTISLDTFVYTEPAGRQGIYLLKVKSQGDIVFARKLADARAADLDVYTFTTDDAENVYTIGNANGPPVYFGDYPVHGGTPPFAANVFVAKCDNAGRVVWVTMDGGYEGLPTAITVDKCNYVWASGYYSSGYNHDNGFINEYSMSGQLVDHIYLTSGGGWGGIEVDNKGSFVYGNDFETTYFGLGSTGLHLTGTANTFLAKFRYFVADTSHISSDSVICAPGMHVLKGPPGFMNYDWSDGTKGMYDTISGSGVYVVTASITCNGTKVITDTFKVSYRYPADTILASHDTTLCSAILSTLFLPGGWSTYVWNDGRRNIVHHIDSAGTYWGLSESPCTTKPSRIDTFHVSFWKGTEDTFFETRDTLLCANNVLSLAAPAGYPHYAWQNGDTTRIIAATDTGLYWVICNPACPILTARIDTIRVGLYPEGLVFSLGKDTIACGPFSLSLPAGSSSYVWQDGSSGTNFTVDKSGIYYCTASEKGCRFSDTISVSIPDLTQHLRDTTVCAETFDGLQVIAAPPPGARCTWSTGASTNHITISEPGIYWVTVTEGACSVADTMQLKTEHCSVQIHDGISPNGDGINDTWIIEGIDNYPNSIVEIFDKLGDEVYQKKGYNNDWGGTGKGGAALPDGTYYYVVRLNMLKHSSESDIFKGALLIKR